MELSLEVNLLKRDLGKVLLKLESLQDEQIKANKAPEEKKIITLSEADHTAALELLKSPKTHATHRQRHRTLWRSR